LFWAWLSDDSSSPLLPLLHQNQIKESFSTCSSKSAHYFFPFISFMKWLAWSEAQFSNLFSLSQDLVLPCTVWAPENANPKAPRVPWPVTWNPWSGAWQCDHWLVSYSGAAGSYHLPQVWCKPGWLTLWHL
jgi:hypothetical protein